MTSLLREGQYLPEEKEHDDEETPTPEPIFGRQSRVDLEAIRGERIVAGLAQRYDIHPKPVMQWNAVAGARDGCV